MQEREARPVEQTRQFSAAELRRGFSLGASQVLPELFLVRRGARDIRLTERTMSALCYLASKAREVVTREELEQHLWPDGDAPASGLSHCIRDIRNALDDAAVAGQSVETVGTRGYRLTREPVPPPAPSPAEDRGKEAYGPDEAEAPSVLSGFWQELRQRRVFRVAVTYVLIVWALLQAADVMLPLLGLPDWMMAAVFLITLVGFPLVLLLAWTVQWDDDGPHLDYPLRLDTNRGYRYLYLLMTLVVTGLLSILIFRSWEQVSSDEAVVRPDALTEAGTPIPDNSIAVLKFQNIGEDSTDDYFSGGLSEELLNLLAKLQELKVVSRTSSWSLPEGLDVSEIRERLRVEYVLEGSVRRSGDTVRITAQLIETSDGYHVWSETFDRRMSDLFKVQDEVARQITDALAILLSEKSRRYLQSDTIDNVAAYDSYLQGLQWLRKPVDELTLAEAEKHFIAARDEAPEFARAWAGLCRTYLGRYRLSQSSEDFRQAEAACHRTLTLDETSPGILEALGDLFASSGQHERARESYSAALVLAPSSSEAMIGLGESLAHTGDPEAEEYLEKAVRTDPGYWKTHNALGTFYFNRGRAREAIPHFHHVTLLAPQFTIGHNNLGAAYMVAGDYRQAVDQFEISLSLAPDRNAYSNAGTAQFLLRDFEGAAKMYQKAVELAPDNYRLWGNLGDALMHAGEHPDSLRAAYSQALELARKARLINPSDPGVLSSIAVYEARLGNRKQALSTLALIDEQAANMYVYYDICHAYLALDDKESALAALRSLVASGYDTSLIEQDPGFDVIREEPEFQTIVAARD